MEPNDTNPSETGILTEPDKFGSVDHSASVVGDVDVDQEPEPEPERISIAAGGGTDAFSSPPSLSRQAWLLLRSTKLYSQQKIKSDDPNTYRPNMVSRTCPFSSTGQHQGSFDLCSPSSTTMSSSIYRGTRTVVFAAGVSNSRMPLVHEGTRFPEVQMG